MNCDFFSALKPIFLKPREEKLQQNKLYYTCTKNMEAFQVEIVVPEKSNKHDFWWQSVIIFNCDRLTSLDPYKSTVQ